MPARAATLLAAWMTLSGAVADDGPGLGRPAPPDDIAAVDRSVFPDGRGLPPGGGVASAGAPLFQAYCVACHGLAGRGGAAEALSGGGSPLTSDTPDKVIGTYWPYATTLFDFIRRAMPLNAPGVLSNDQVYAVTAYLLHINGVIGPEFEINADTLPRVAMPNRDGFIGIDAEVPRYAAPAGD